MDEFDDFRVEIDVHEVPQNLKDGVPMGCKGGLGGYVARSPVEGAASEDEKQAFRPASAGRTKEVTGCCLPSSNTASNRAPF